MSAKMEEFRTFVSKHPLLRDEVRNNKFTWQNVYEEWVLYGEEDESWKKYEKIDTENAESINVDNDQQNTTESTSSTVNLDSIKSIMNYVQKINPDSLNKTLNTVQKVIQIAQTFSGPKGTASIPTSSIYSDWWD